MGCWFLCLVWMLACLSGWNAYCPEGHGGLRSYRRQYGNRGVRHGPGSCGFVFVLLRWLTQTSFVSLGLYLGLIATAATAAGAFLSGKDVGIGIPSIADFAGGGDDTPSGESPTV